MASVEMRKESRWWYGTLTTDGKRKAHNLGIEVAGQRPSPDLPDGDAVFQASRARAEAKLESMREDATRKGQTEDLIQALHEARTGRRVGSIALRDMAARWAELPRRHRISDTYAKWAQSVFRGFVAFIAKTAPTKQAMSDIVHEDAAAFFRHEDDRKIAPRTWNAELGLLKGAFKNLRRAAGMPENPFEGIPTQDEDSIHRRPFSADDLRVILDAAGSDPLLRPLIVTGMCTAMRLGDVCQLRWQDVDLRHRFITVKTGKTGARVSIPMFPMLVDELAVLPRTPPHVFPEAARLYKARPDMIQRRLQEVFRRAGFFNPKDDRPKWTLPTKPHDWQPTASAAIAAAQIPDARRSKLLQVLDLYAGGATTSTVAQTAAISRGSVSHYLHEIEKLAGFRIVRRRELPPKPEQPHRENMLVDRDRGLRRASVHGFHSFRTTWVTLALTAGVPIDLVRKVTGHRTADIVLQNYFQPGREQFRQVLQAKMPALLSNGAKTPTEQAVEVLRGATAKTWKKAIERAIALLVDSAA